VHVWDSCSHRQPVERFPFVPGTTERYVIVTDS
jgi:hypothetical protein